jgi:hypothetical protein
VRCPLWTESNPETIINAARVVSVVPVVHCDYCRRAANEALREEVAKEQDELVKLSQTNEENRACRHARAFLSVVIRLQSSTGRSSESSPTCQCPRFCVDAAMRARG